jgi:Mg2+-importing ATPase
MGLMALDRTTDYASLDLATLTAALDSGPQGLTGAEAARRLTTNGPNSLKAQGRTAPLKLALRQVESPLVLILIFAALVAAGVGEIADAVIILAIVLLSTILGFSQEYSASRALDQLRSRLALKVTVLRDGKPVSVDAATVVPGDVITLSAGNLVPADGVVLAAKDFLVSQAALTGETFPVEKFVPPSPPGASLPQQTNVVFQSTSVRSGTATVLLVRTGRTTVFGAIADRLRETASETDFERGIRHFGTMLTRIMTVIVTLVLAANLALHRPLVDSLLFSVALAVGLTPELLPAIISVTMSAGARRMAKEGVIVRRTAAIENLGSVDVLCTDKTGTLTQGVIELSDATDPEGKPSATVRRLALLNASLETGIMNPLDEAIVASAKGNLPVLPKVDEVPYDFVRKRLTIVCDQPDQTDHLMITKGATDTVLSCCTHIAWADGIEPLTAAVRARLDAFCEARGTEGFRMLGVASRRFPPQPHYGREDEAGMVFEGFLHFFDPLKDGIVETLGSLRAMGISVKVITGDSRHVAAHVATAVGLKGALVTGAQITAAPDDALLHLAQSADIFAEIDPQQKERIVRALQKRGHSVAYMGDGINDAPALRAADVGISVDSAVDVARDSADIVLLQRDLGVLQRGIADGRRTFANTLKYISITTSANFGNMVSMAIATMYLPFLPLTAAQILLNNFLSDFPSVAISTDNVDPETVAVAPRWDIKGIRSFMVVFGLVSTLFDFLTFALLNEVFHAGVAEFQSTWFLISLMTELAVVLILRTRRRSWQSVPGRVLWLSTVVMLIAALAVPYLGPVSAWVGLIPLPIPLALTSVAIVAGYIAATEAAKAWYYRRDRATRV